MKKILIAAAVAVLCATGANAADLKARTYTKAPPIAPAYSWTGFYAGVNVGYGFNDPTVSYVAGDPLFAGIVAAPSASYDVKGVIGGGQIGYNWQFSPTWLWGLEADFNGSDIRGTGNSAFTMGGFPSQIVANQSVEWFGTVRARLGWLPASNLLVYGTGGFAYGSVKENVTLNTVAGVGGIGFGFSFTCPTGTNCFLGSSSNIATGYTAGAGLEYAFWKNVTLKVEYLYVNLGSQASVRSVAVNNFGTPSSSFIANFSDLDFNVVRVGANYRF
ncbi:MAG: porin family protein [Afipia sp.]|nr:porin family protein [Afipia sp.]